MLRFCASAGAAKETTMIRRSETRRRMMISFRVTVWQRSAGILGALADYSKTIELDSSHALAYASRGVVKVLLKKLDYAADFETYQWPGLLSVATGGANNLLIRLRH